MSLSHLLDAFQGIQTLLTEDPGLAVARLVLIALGVALVFLGNKGILEPLLMVPMGFGMVAVNAGVLFLASGKMGTLFVDPLVTEPNQLVDILQVNFLQPVYTFTFSNGLIACFVFMGIGSILDVSYLMARPLQSTFLALAGEFGTLAAFPIGRLFGLSEGEAAAAALTGGADGPMVMYTALNLAKEVFVPITVIAYLYLGLTYAVYPYLLIALVPKRILATAPVKEAKPIKTTPLGRLTFTIVCCAVLCLLFPVAAPLFLSLFVGVAVREAGLKPYVQLLSEPVLYASTFLLGLLLGVLCEAHTLFNPAVFPLLALGVLALTLSAIGGIFGGYVLYFLSGKRFNPAIGLAAVSCVPSTAKIVQKAVSDAAPGVMVLPHAIGANVCGVITTAIICGLYNSLIP